MGRHSKLQDRVKGVLLGLAAGDRIGGPTKMATLLAESLVENSTFDSKDVGRKYFDWWEFDGSDAGLVNDKVFSLVSDGVPRPVAISKVDRELGGMTAGCNPVHRNSPIAMSAHFQDNEIPRIAERESLLM